MTGSGPFKLVEFKPGVKTVYVKNAAYVPRRNPPAAWPAASASRWTGSSGW